jgi:metal-dependent amidase/aminoacylase/carboxypeptidase family protein
MDDASAGFNVHLGPSLPSDISVTATGAIFTTKNNFQAILHDRGGPAGVPQKNVDCMPYAACCVAALQALLAREVAPADSAVISVIQLQMEDGQLLSIMPSKINIVGPMRALTVQAQLRLQSRLEQVLHAQFASCRCTAELDWHMYVNALYLVPINNAQLGKWRPKQRLRCWEVTM